MAREFSPDYIPGRYGSLQRALCEDYGLEVSDTVIFGVGDHRFKYFDIDGVSNRVCITPSIKAHLDRQRARA